MIWRLQFTVSGLPFTRFSGWSPNLRRKSMPLDCFESDILF